MSRTPIPDAPAAQVMFASDRTCCVCRTEKLKLQIHHIDENASNNHFANLAVICLHCHSDAHTNGAFVRNLTPELIRLYNSSWRAIANLRLNGDQSAGRKEFASEAYLEVSLDCHSWKIWYMSLHRSDFPDATPGSRIDVWDAMIDFWQHDYSVETWTHFLPLFSDAVVDIQRRFDRLIQLFPDVLPYDFRTVLLRAQRQLNSERVSYLTAPHLSKYWPQITELTPTFNARFKSVLQILRDVAREADRRRDAIFAEVATNDIKPS